MNISYDGIMKIGNPPVAILDLNTGHVELFGDPNDAALLFWEAIEVMQGSIK